MDAPETSRHAPIALEVLRAIARDLSGQLSPAQVADVFVETVQDRFQANATVVYLTDGSPEMTLAAARGIPENELGRVRKLPLSRPLPLNTAVRTGQAQWYDTHAALLADYPHLSHSYMPRERLQAIAAIPFALGGRVLGGVAFSFDAEHRIGAGDRQQLLMLAELAAQAIDRARWIEAERCARDEVARANRAKDEFLATLSHELRSPLNVIAGWVNLLQNHQLDREQSDRGLAIIERNVKAQIRLIEDVLDISRIVSGKLRIEPQPVSMRSIVKAACDGLRPAAEAKGLRLEVPEPDPDGCVVEADAERLQQVIGNLLSNAIKFTPSGGRIHVALERRSESVIVRVSDTGEGIDPSFSSSLFERFVQADRGSTRQHGGLGLGLSICRHLVELHGGKIEAYSAGRGCGATFSVSLRAHHAGAALPDAARPTLANIRGYRVLICDDDVDAREILAELLHARGADAFTVASGNEARSWLAVNQADILLCDIGMPGEDGFSLLAGLRARNSSVPAIAITAYASSSDARRALSVGFQAHMAKPVDTARLVQAIGELVPPRERRAEP